MTDELITRLWQRKLKEAAPAITDHMVNYIGQMLCGDATMAKPKPKPGKPKPGC